MATFELTAKYNTSRPGGLYIEKGQQITININMMGIEPGNLFGNNRCKDMLVQQFKLNGINVPPTDTGIYGRGLWDVRKL